MKSYNVAVVGATGLVGQEFLRILEQRHFPVKHLALCASDRSVGKRLSFAGEEVPVFETSNDSFKNIDIAFFSAGGQVSAHFAPIAAESGAVVIDNSATFRMNDRVPLVVPEINPEDCQKHEGIIANPNCSTIQMVVALNPLHKAAALRRVIVDTYQSVSGTGTPALEELSSQAKLILEGKSVIPHVYPHQIAFNVLPEIDVFLDNGYSKEEWKMVNETRKIMHLPDLPVSATTVRVPVFLGHSEAVHAEFASKLTAEDARAILAETRGVRVLDEPTVSMYPQPWSVAGQDDVFVGRIREDASHPYGLAMWVVADNIRKGAALNGAQIAEVMIERGWL